MNNNRQRNDERLARRFSAISSLLGGESGNSGGFEPDWEAVGAMLSLPDSDRFFTGQRGPGLRTALGFALHGHRAPTPLPRWIRDLISTPESSGNSWLDWRLFAISGASAEAALACAIETLPGADSLFSLGSDDERNHPLSKLSFLVDKPETALRAAEKIGRPFDPELRQRIGVACLRRGDPAKAKAFMVRPPEEAASAKFVAKAIAAAYRAADGTADKRIAAADRTAELLLAFGIRLSDAGRSEDDTPFHELAVSSAGLSAPLAEKLLSPETTGRPPGTLRNDIAMLCSRKISARFPGMSELCGSARIVEALLRRGDRFDASPLPFHARVLNLAFPEARTAELEAFSRIVEQSPTETPPIDPAAAEDTSSILLRMLEQLGATHRAEGNKIAWAEAILGVFANQGPNACRVDSMQQALAKAFRNNPPPNMEALLQGVAISKHCPTDEPARKTAFSI